MISMNNNKPFFAAHWDWLLTIAAVLALGGAVAWTVVELGVDPEENANSELSEITGKAPKTTTEKIADMTAFEDATKGYEEPATVKVPEADKASWLVSGMRVFCQNGDMASEKKSCGRPIPFGAKVCPYSDCRVTQPVEVKPVLDSDGDGMDDDYEKAMGLNPNDPSDADGDLDNDGFTNYEEFVAKTDPRDPKSHPDYLDSLKATANVKQTFLPFFFTGVYKTPSGLKYNFKDPSRSNEYDRGNYSVYEGTEIGKTGFIAKKYTAKSEKRKMGGGMDKTIDVSEATIERKMDGKLINMVLNKRQTPVDIQATLRYERGSVKEFAVVKGSEFELNGNKYRVKDLVKSGGSLIVTVEDLAGGNTRKLTVLLEQ